MNITMIYKFRCYTFNIEARSSMKIATSMEQSTEHKSTYRFTKKYSSVFNIFSSDAWAPSTFVDTICLMLPLRRQQSYSLRIHQFQCSGIELSIRMNFCSKKPIVIFILNWNFFIWDNWKNVWYWAWAFLFLRLKQKFMVISTWFPDMLYMSF